MSLSLTTPRAASAYPHHFDAMEPNPLVAETACSRGGGDGMAMSKVMQSAQNIYLLSRVGTKRGLDQPVLKRMLRELCDLESQLTNISPESSPMPSPRPSSPVADVCSSPSSPSPSTSSTSSPPRSASTASSSSSAAKRNITKTKKKQQLRRRAYVCSGCGATESSQWRNGPDGTKICNPCGMKFWRLKRKMMKRQAEAAETPSSSPVARPNKPSGLQTGGGYLHHLRPHHPPSASHHTNATAAAIGLSHLGAVQQNYGAYHPHQQQLLVPFDQPRYVGQPSFVSGKNGHLQNDEEVMAAGVMMQHLRSASFSSVTQRGDGSPARPRPSSSLSFSSSAYSPSASLSSSLSFSSVLSSPTSSPSPSPTPFTSERKRSSIYDLLN